MEMSSPLHKRTRDDVDADAVDHDADAAGSSSPSSSDHNADIDTADVAGASLVSAIVGGGGASSKQSGDGTTQFSSTNQPEGANKRPRSSGEYEPNPEKRRKLLWRYITKLRKTVEAIERTTDTPIVVLCSTEVDDATGRPVVQHVLGRQDSVIMRACWSDPRCEATRNAIWDAESTARKARAAQPADDGAERDSSADGSHPEQQSKDQAAPETDRPGPKMTSVVDINTARTQLRAELGCRPGFGKPERRPKWWPAVVAWRYDYSLQKMSKRDLGIVHAAFCTYQELRPFRVVSSKQAAEAAAAAAAAASATTTPGAAAFTGTMKNASAAKTTTAKTTAPISATKPKPERSANPAGTTNVLDSKGSIMPSWAPASARVVPPPIPYRYGFNRSGGDDVVSKSRVAGFGSSWDAVPAAGALGPVDAPVGLIPCAQARPRTWQPVGGTGRSSADYGEPIGPATASGSIPAAAPQELVRRGPTIPRLDAAAGRAAAAGGPVAGAGHALAAAVAGDGLAAAAAAAPAAAGQRFVTAREMVPSAARQPHLQGAYRSFLSLQSEELRQVEGANMPFGQRRDVGNNVHAGLMLI